MLESAEVCPASVDVAATVARRFIAATWSLLMFCRSRAVHNDYLVVVEVADGRSGVHSGYLVAVVAVALPPRLRLLSGQPLR